MYIHAIIFIAYIYIGMFIEISILYFFLSFFFSLCNISMIATQFFATDLCREQIISIRRLEYCCIFIIWIDIFMHNMKRTRFIKSKWHMWRKGIDPSKISGKEVARNVHILIASSYFKNICFRPVII